MSEHVNKQPKAEFFDQRHAGNLPLWLPVVGVVALVISIVWGFFDHEQFAYSWLFAFFYFFTLVVGSLFWVLVHHTTDAEWSVVVRRILENVGWLIPALALCFIPVAAFSIRRFLNGGTFPRGLMKSSTKSADI